MILFTPKKLLFDNHGIPALALLVLIFTSFQLLFPAPTFSESKEYWVKVLDEKYYYPQDLGLKKLSVDVSWEQFQTGARLESPSNSFMAVFNWEASEGNESRGFELAENIPGYSAQRKVDVLRFLQNYQEIVLPRKLHQVLRDTRLDNSTKGPMSAFLNFQVMNPNFPVLRYELEVDTINRRIQKFKIYRNSEPKVIESQMSYIKKDGKWLVAETRSEFQVHQTKYFEKMTYSYKNVSGYWLPYKMIHKVDAGNNTLSTLHFTFSNYTID